jgi:parallel beta-helix repeat protein
MSRPQPGPLRLVSAVCFAAATVASPLAQRVEGAQWFVAVHGEEGNRGTKKSPWNIDYGLSDSSPSNPGDTIWILGGNYTGRFYCSLAGTAKRPFLVRNWKGDRVTLATAPRGPVYSVLEVAGSHTLIWGLEIVVTRPTTTEMIDGVRFHGSARYNRLINCIIHDATNCGIADQDAAGTELYGNIVYYAGRRTQGGNAYAVYGQNHEGFPPKLYEDNIFLHTFAGYTLHMYSEGQTVDSIVLKHNVVANTTGKAQLMFSSARRNPQGVIVDTNYFWGTSFTEPLLTERKGMEGPVYRGNYFLRGLLMFRSATRNRVFTGNYVWGEWPIETTSGKEPPWPRVDTTGFSGNALYLGRGMTPPRPPLNRVFVRPNRYERGRATVIVYNLSGRKEVEVDLSRVLRHGETYEVRDAQNFYGRPAVSGTFSGGPVRLPMTGGTVPDPVTLHPEFPPPVHTEQGFGVFVVLGTPRH